MSQLEFNFATKKKKPVKKDTEIMRIYKTLSLHENWLRPHFLKKTQMTKRVLCWEQNGDKKKLKNFLNEKYKTAKT